MIRYSFDTSVFIEGRKRYFRPQNFPRVWENIGILIADGDIRAIDNVKRELEKREGSEITEWALAQEGLFLPVEEEVEIEASRIIAVYPRLVRQNTSEADPWVIALARVYDCTVVTDEKPKSTSNPKIPDVCADLNIDCIHIHEFISREGWTF